MKQLWLISFTCLVLLGGVNQLSGQDVDLSKLDSTELAMLSQFYDMSLEELESLQASAGLSSELEKVLNSFIEVAARSRSFSTRSAPSVVTLITEEEIKNSGARDLIDVLRLVPGFHFALDLNGKVGLGVRGNWSNEGKILLMIDGQEMNDIFSANLSFGNHYPVELIERIEVVRGPGSAVYGGFAEYGVINIVTKQTAGIKVGISNGRYVDQGVRARRNNQVYVGLEGGKNGIYFSYFGGKGQRSVSDQFGYYRYSDDRADSLGRGRFGSLNGNSSINPRMFNLHIKAGGFHFRNMTDLYEVTDVTTIDEEGQRPIRNALRTNYSELRFDIKLLKKRLTLTPKLNFIAQAPEVKGLEDSAIVIPLRNELTARAKGSFIIDYDVSHRVNFTVGAEIFADGAIFSQDDGLVEPITDTLLIGNAALYGQLVVRTPFVNITGGLRYDYNEAYGQAFSPRIGLTKQFRRFHFKLLGSGAFRAPSIGNVALAFDGTYDINADSSRLVNVGREIDPERTLYFEAEVGYQFTRDMIMSANIFNFTSTDPIVFHFYQDETIRNIFGDDAGFFAYQNFPQSGTWGIELDYRFKKRWGYLYANYSFYSTYTKSNPQPYEVRTFNLDPEMRNLLDTDQLLAFPQHKVNANACFYLGRKKNLSLNLTGSWYSKRYSYDVEVSGPNEVQGILTQRPATFLANAYLRHNNFILKGLDVGIGVYDIFNKKYDYLQPYFGLNVPLPGPSRELVVKASYDLSFGNKKRKKQQEEIEREKKNRNKKNDSFSNPRNTKS